MKCASNFFWGSLQIITAAAFLAICLSGTAATAPRPVEEILRETILNIEGTKSPVLRKEPLAATTLLSALYKENGYRLLWTRAENAEQLILFISMIEADGLNPTDYHYPILEQLTEQVRARGDTDLRLVTDIDILLTDSLVRLYYHFVHGKADPKSINSEWDFDREGSPPSKTRFLSIIGSDDLGVLLQGLRPRNPFYTRLAQVLSRYLVIERSGGWAAIPEGPALEEGVKDHRVSTLRQRLAATGDFTGSDRQSPLFDSKVKAALISFQARHGLSADGKVNTSTRVALNTSVRSRIDQIRVNMERGRWVLHALPRSFLVVDIAGYHVYFIRDHEIIWSSRVQVGQPYRQTPVFKANMTYLVFNPDWTVPPGILEKDVLPRVLEDPEFLTANDYAVVDSHGKRVDPDSISWTEFSAQTLPYKLVQAPGPDNPMGRVKFIFPNHHLVFLHDTNERDEFESDWRAFSSGCIRVEDPLDLAALVLDDPSRWSTKDLEQIVISGKTRTDPLQKPLPVLLMYWTVFVDRNGTVFFKEDVYGRDRAILDALDGTVDLKKFH